MHNTIKKLYIEASSRCNLNCKMCFRHTWKGEQFGDLRLSGYLSMMEDPVIENIDTVFFGGMGEPLVHPDLITMVEGAAKRGKNVELITNGTLLTEPCLKNLMAAGIKKIWVSIDEVSENYEKIQIGSSFDLIRNHLELFNRMRKGTDVQLGLTTVVMKDNISRLHKILDFASHLNADDLNLSHMLPNRIDDVSQTLWPLCDYAHLCDTAQQEGLSFEQDLCDTWDFSFSAADGDIEQADEDIELPLFQFREEDGKKLFGDLDSDDYSNLFVWKGKQMTRRQNYCRFIAEGNCFVRWDGNVSPCMGLLHSADTFLRDKKRTVWHHSFGNIYEKSLSEIWNSEEYQSFRERVVRFDFSPCFICGGCNLLENNEEDCFGNTKPTCGGCLWAQGFIVCP